MSRYKQLCKRAVIVSHVQHQHLPSCPAEFSDLLPEDMIPKDYITFRHVIPVSAATGFGIEDLKSLIRKTVDEEAEMANRTIHVERLRALEQYSQNAG